MAGPGDPSKTNGEAGAGFELRSETLYSAAQLAAKFGVTAQTVANWVAKGMPTAGKDSRGMKFDRAACETWREGHVFGSKGGRRAGAGAKPKMAQAPTAATEQLTDAASTERVAGGSPVNIDSAEDILASIDGGKSPTPSQARVAADVIIAATRRKEFDKISGKLVDREEMRGLVGRHLRAVRMQLDALPARVTRAVEENGLDRVHGAVVRAAVQREVDSALRALLEDPLGERVVEKTAA